LILSENPKLKPSEVRDIIMKSATKIAGLEQKLVSGARIDAYAAMRMTLARRDGASSKVLAELDADDASEAAEVVSEAKADASKNAKRDVAFH